MKKTVISSLLIISAFLLILLVSGCSADIPDTDPGMTGYVMKTEGGRILVVDPVAQDFSSTGGIDEFYNAIWFSNVPDSISEGDKVNVWFDVVAESYPGQSEALAVEVLPSPRLDRANLNESEALHKALAAQEPDTAVAVVKSIKYEEEIGIWIIELQDVFSGEGHTIEVED